MRRGDEFWERVYNVLVREAGAIRDESLRVGFVRYQMDDEPGPKEWRFQGALGFGGKFWSDSSGRLEVNCYKEDETPERAAIIKRTNAALRAEDEAIR